MASLMSYSGEDIYNITDELSDELKSHEGETHYNRLVTTLDNHFNPQLWVPEIPFYWMK